MDNVLQTTPEHKWRGYVAQDKDPNSVYIQVFVPELLPASTGQLGSTTSNQSVPLMDINGASTQTSVTTTNVLTAIYKGGSTNRKYPPDVVKGEQVIVTRLGDSDQLYWESSGRDDAMRTTETVRFEAANRKDFNDQADDSHTYSFELDSKRNKHIRLQTSKGNGEAFAYVLRLDTAGSQIQLSDDAGNSITIDSANNRVIMRNGLQAFLMLNGQDVSLMAPRDLTIKAGRQIVTDSPLVSVSNTDGSGVFNVTSNAIGLSATTSFVTTAPAIGLNGAVKIPSILATAQVRAQNYTNGAVGSSYGQPSISISAAEATIPAAPPDTTVSTTQRHAVAYENYSAAMATVVACFNQIQGHIGLPTAQSTIPAQVTASEMDNLDGV
ncbi:unnamed protein product [Sphagnum jensenii]|uniref:Uncharacterized protein n=1 Tax=Sphagnum jensenii TaxID=128206 RepID=A0ABP0VIY6_9BRYO